MCIRDSASADRTIQAPGEATLCLDVPELGVIPSVSAERARSFAYYRRGRKMCIRDRAS